MRLGWLTSSILGLLMVTPAWLAIGFFKKNFGVPSEVFVIWYSLGVGIGSFFFLRLYQGLSILPPVPVALGIFFTGISIGAISNLLIFRAVALAPNPGLALAVNSASIILVSFLSAALASIIPRYFDHVQVRLLDIIAILLVLGGIAIIALRK